MQHWGQTFETLAPTISGSRSREINGYRLGIFYNVDLQQKDITQYGKPVIGQARRLLQFFGFRIIKLKMWEETTKTFGRVLDPKPKKEYFALEWRTVQKICNKTRKDADPYVDSVIGRAILTIAYTTGARVGSLLPSRNKKRAKKHTPITRRNIRKVRDSFHI